MADSVNNLQVPNHIHTHKVSKMTLGGNVQINQGVEFEGNPSLSGVRMDNCIFRNVEQLKDVNVSTMEVTGLKIKFKPVFS